MNETVRSVVTGLRMIDNVERRIQLFRTVGASKRYVELEMDKIRDISGDLVDDISE